MLPSKLILPTFSTTPRRHYSIAATAAAAIGRSVSSLVLNTSETVNRNSKNVSWRAYYHNNSYSGLPRQVNVVGAKSLVREGCKAQTPKPPSTTALIREVLDDALEQAGLTTLDLDGVVAVPSLYGNHFMEAHYQATALGLFAERETQTFESSSSRTQKSPRPLRCRTLDTGGAGPVSAVLEAERMISSSSSSSSGEGLEVVAVIAADTVGSMTGDDFLDKADAIFFKLRDELGLPKNSVTSPAIPHGYDRITDHQLSTTSLQGEQLQMVVSLESFHAGLHPESLQSQKTRAKAKTIGSSNSDDNGDGDIDKEAYPFTTLEQIQSSPSITPNISLLECARRADGAACLILASNRFLKRRNLWKPGIPAVIGGGQFSGPLYPPTTGITDHTYVSCQQAMDHAYASAGNLTARDIQYFGLYDCFPICLIRAVEACGLAGEGCGQDCTTGGDYIEKQYDRMLAAMDDGTVEALLADPAFFPINTHGGLLCFGAPWEVPAMFGVVEAVDQITGRSSGRPIGDCRRALVYGNGGILSASAVAILAAS
jgi:hypothetical protein